MGIEKARRVRASQAAALAALGNGAASLADTLREPPKALRTVDLYVVLMACPNLGKVRTRTVCERARVWPHLTLGELNNWQRRALIESLPKGT